MLYIYIFQKRLQSLYYEYEFTSLESYRPGLLITNYICLEGGGLANRHALESDHFSHGGHTRAFVFGYEKSVLFFMDEYKTFLFNGWKMATNTAGTIFPFIKIMTLYKTLILPMEILSLFAQLLN